MITAEMVPSYAPFNAELESVNKKMSLYLFDYLKPQPKPQ